MDEEYQRLSLRFEKLRFQINLEQTKNAELKNKIRGLENKIRIDQRNLKRIK